MHTETLTQFPIRAEPVNSEDRVGGTVFNLIEYRWYMLCRTADKFLESFLWHGKSVIESYFKKNFLLMYDMHAEK